MTANNQTSLTQKAEQITEANHRFYSAFLQRDFDVLADCWEHSARTVCVHPGRPPLRGWNDIGPSWRARLEKYGGTLTTVSVNTVSVVIAADTAWLTGDVDLVSRQGAAAVASMNIFARQGNSWLMVAHHASVITAFDGSDD